MAADWRPRANGPALGKAGRRIAADGIYKRGSIAPSTWLHAARAASS
jgi:hypothetical protein